MYGLESGPRGKWCREPFPTLDNDSMRIHQRGSGISVHLHFTFLRVEPRKRKL